MLTALRSPRAQAAPPRNASGRPWSSHPPRVAGRALLAGALAVAGAVLLACGGRGSRTVHESAGVRGATYALRAVDGTPLPTHFAPVAYPQADTNVRMDSGRVTFDREGRARGAWYGTGESQSLSQVFSAAYVEDGARVLIYRHGGSAPDTGEVSGKTLTVRAQFFRQPTRERYVVVMTYER